jgi:hypothetical protein
MFDEFVTVDTENLTIRTILRGIPLGTLGFGHTKQFYQEEPSQHPQGAFAMAPHNRRSGRQEVITLKK